MGKRGRQADGPSSVTKKAIPFLSDTDEAEGRFSDCFKVLVCIGDSRGQIHMNHLFLR